jgi:hypothetical protein
MNQAIELGVSGTDEALLVFLQAPKSIKLLTTFIEQPNVSKDAKFRVLSRCLGANPIPREILLSMQTATEILIQAVVQDQDLDGCDVTGFLQVCVGHLHEFNSQNLKKLLIKALRASRTPICYQIFKRCEIKSTGWLLREWISAVCGQGSDVESTKVIITLVDDMLAGFRDSPQMLPRDKLAGQLTEVVEFCLHSKNRACFGMWNELWHFISSGSRSAANKRLVGSSF